MKAAVLLCCLLIAGNVFSQERKPTVAGLPVTSYTAAIDTAAYLKAINQLILKSFATIASGQGEASNFTTYGSFEPVNGAYKFNTYGMAGSKDSPIFFNLSAKGDIIGDNTGVIFSNSKFSSSTTVSGKFHIPLNKLNIDIDGYEKEQVLDKIRLLKKNLDQQKAESQLNGDPSNIKNQFYSACHRLQLEEQKMISLQQKLDTVNRKITSITYGNESAVQPWLDSAAVLVKQLKAAQKLQSNLQFTSDSLAVYFNSVKLNMDHSEELFRWEEAFNSKRDSLMLTLPVIAQKISWLTVVGSFNRTKYYTFDGKLPWAQQLGEVKHDNFNFGLEYNLFKSSSPFWEFDSPNAGLPKNPNLQILNIGFVRMGASDIDDYMTTEMTQSRKFALGDSTNSLGKKYNVYTDPINEYKAWKLYVNYYYFIGKNNTMALHVFPDIQFRNTNRNPFTLGAGFVFSLKNKKDNSVFNVELYTKFIDVGKALPEKEKSFINRNEIGLNFAVPINLPKK